MKRTAPMNDNTKPHRTAKVIPIVIKGGLLQGPPEDCPWKDMNGTVVDVTLCEFFCHQSHRCPKYTLLQQHFKEARRRRREMEEQRREENHNV